MTRERGQPAYMAALFERLILFGGDILRLCLGGVDIAVSDGRIGGPVSVDCKT